MIAGNRKTGSQEELVNYWVPSARCLLFVPTGFELPALAAQRPYAVVIGNFLRRHNNLPTATPTLVEMYN